MELIIWVIRGSIVGRRHGYYVGLVFRLNFYELTHVFSQMMLKYSNKFYARTWINGDMQKEECKDVSPDSPLL